ncbi:MAG: GNAT family N-acetyltransferase [Oscillospiraceae bacterium]|nr:GNAT family N-acetyltransferase [Oscillospiraceae bacterium]
MIRKMMKSDIHSCSEILCAVYNNELWQCRWTAETAYAYLEDYFNARKFAGFVMEENDKIIGAMFAHEKIWWNNSELFIDEMFVLPELQRNGYGSMLIKVAEDYVKAHKLAGFTLSTNKYAPAPNFYRKNGFTDCEHILFMCKEVE